MRTEMIKVNNIRGKRIVALSGNRESWLDEIKGILIFLVVSNQT